MTDLKEPIQDQNTAEEAPATESQEQQEQTRFNKAREKRRTFRDAVLKHIAEEVKSAIPPEALDQYINEHLASGELEKVFTPLLILKDRYREINTTYTEEFKTPLLLRDARNQTEAVDSKPEAIFCNYAILGFNYLNGLKDLLKIFSEKHPDKGIALNTAYEDLNALAREYYKHIMPSGGPKEDPITADFHAEARFGQFLHTVIVPYYRQYDTEITEAEAIKKISLARDFATMKLPPYAVATVSRTKLLNEFQAYYNNKNHVDHIELEIPLLELTDKQIEMYQDRENQDWYNCQSETARALIDKYAEPIISGQCMIPAQLIYRLIGMRNGYEKVTAQLPSLAEASTKILNSTFHAGSQAHLLKQDPKSTITKDAVKEACQKATNATIEQVILATGATETQHFNTLVSPGNHFRRDPKIAQQIKEAVRTHNESAEEGSVTAAYNNTPINFARKFSSAELSGIEEIIKAANEILEQNAPMKIFLDEDQENNEPSFITYKDIIKGYLTSHSNENPNQDLLLLLLKVHYCIQALQGHINRQAPDITRNTNLDIAAEANLLVGYIQQLCDEDQSSKISIISGCLSGQDRGGMNSAHTTNKAMYDELKAKISAPSARSKAKKLKKQEQLFRDTQAFAGATQKQTGGPGAGHGPDHIKAHSKLMIPKSYSKKARQTYVGVTGKYNEKIPKNPNKPFYKKKGFRYGVASILLGLALIATGVLAIKGIILVVGGGATVAYVIGGGSATAGLAKITNTALNANYYRKLKLPKNDYEVPEAKFGNNAGNNADQTATEEPAENTPAIPEMLSDDESEKSFHTAASRSRSNSIDSNASFKSCAAEPDIVSANRHNIFTENAIRTQATTEEEPNEPDEASNNQSESLGCAIQ